MEVGDGGPVPVKRQAVKRHHHKHNLKHRYEFLQSLGKGTYGRVKKARERTGRMVAIKSIRKEKIRDEQELIHIRREIEIMSSLSHPHIISIYEVFENADKIVLVMEYASGGDLFDYVSERQRLTESEARHFFRQIVSAVQHCHRNGVVHRDLKLENILLDEHGNIKIADFGLSNLFEAGRLLQTFCGSPLYASPEIVRGRPYTGPEVDSWALGVLLYTLVHGAMPFDGRDHRSLVRQISSGSYRRPSRASDACGLIRWMLTVDPERRATLDDIAGHWWLNWGYEGPLLAETDTAAPLAGPMGATGPASGPVRITDWLRRTSRPLLDSGSKVRYLLRTGGGAAGEPVTRQRSIRRSRKENNVSQSLQSPSAPEPPRPFKGILKKRNSLKKSQEPLEEKSVNAPDVPNAPVPPPKGILKKPESESGYYSSSPEDLALTPVRKGILKRHGKFSGHLTELGSRDSILSSESFERLDLPERGAPSPAPMQSPRMRACVSADNLQDLREDRPGLWSHPTAS